MEIKDRVLYSEKFEWRKLKPFQPENLKEMGKESFDKLKNSLKSNDFIASFDVWKQDEDNYWILDGHHRKYALDDLVKEGYTVPDKFQCNFIHCDNEQDACYAIVAKASSHAHMTELGFTEWANKYGLDFGRMIETTDIPNFDLEAIWNNNKIGEFEPQCGEDEIPELKNDPISKLGDIWILGNHRLTCGDSTNITDVENLMAGKKANMAFTDPPYGYSYESNSYKDGNPFGMLKNDDEIIDFVPNLYSILDHNSAIYICGSHQTINKWRPLVDHHFKYKNLIVWRKNNWSMGDLKGAYAGQHELIIFAHKGTVNLRGERHRDIWDFDRDPPKDHPTQKPVQLIQFAIENTSDVNNAIVDFFGGSGSTLIACEKTNRICFMMELEPNYCDTIIKRWEKYTGKEAIHEESQKTFKELSQN